MGVDIEAVTRDLPRDRQQAIRHAYAHQAKHDTSAFLFCFFLGTVGAHRFYLGQWRAGFARLALPVLAVVIVVVGLLINLSPVAIVAAVAVVLFFALAWEIVDLFRIDAMIDAYNEGVARRLLGAPTSSLPIPPMPTPTAALRPPHSASPTAPSSTTTPPAGTPVGVLTAEDVAQARELALGVPTGMSSGMSSGMSTGMSAEFTTRPAPTTTTESLSATSASEHEEAPHPSSATPAAPPVWPVDDADTAPIPPTSATPPTAPITVRPLSADPTDLHTPGPSEPLPGDGRPSYVRLPAQHQGTQDVGAPGATIPPATGAEALAPIVTHQRVHPPTQDATDAPSPRDLLGSAGGDALPSGFVAIPPALAATGAATGETTGVPTGDLVTRPSVSGPISPEDAYLTLIPDEPHAEASVAPSPDDTLPWPSPEPRPQTPSHPVPPEAFVPPSVSSPHHGDASGTVPPPRPPLWPIADDQDETTAPIPPLAVTPPQEAPANDNLAELALGVAAGAAAGDLAAEAGHHAEEHHPPIESAPGMATQPEPPTQPLPAPEPPAPLPPTALAAAPTSGALKKVRVVRRVVVDGKVVSERVVEEIVPVETDAAAAAAALDDRLGHLTPEQAAQLANLPPEAQLELRRKMQIERSPNTGNTENGGTTGGTGNTGGGQQG